MSNSANIPGDNERKDLLEDDNNDVEASQLFGQHPSCPSTMDPSSSNWSLASPPSISQLSGLPTPVIAGHTHNKLHLNSEFMRYMNMVNILLNMRDKPAVTHKFRISSSPVLSITSLSVHPYDLASQTSSCGVKLSLPLSSPHPSIHPSYYPLTILWLFENCKTDPSVHLYASNASQPPMQHIIRHEDRQLITLESGRASNIFNKERCCWVELRWSNTNSYFEATRPAADDLNINIPLVDARPIDQQGPIDGQEAENLDTEPPRTEFQLRTETQAASSQTSERSPTPRSEVAEPEEIAVQSPEVDALAVQTAELHIPEPIRGVPFSYMTTQTEVSPPRLVINEQTGHVQQLQPEDMEAVNRAMGPDVPDAPSIHEGPDMFYEFRLNRNRVPSPDNRPFPPLRRPPGGGPPGGGPPGGGPPGGGTPAGGIQQAPQGGNDKFIGNPPPTFTGNRGQAKSFILQWEVYAGVNANHSAMINKYQKAMLFLTYIQGNTVNQWVMSASRWLVNEVATGTSQFDNRLWENLLHAFQRQFGDVLSKERAQAQLDAGIHMKDGKIDDYIANFEQLV
ncbi:hypothetical protein EI94DRAFT_1813809 [Lactarius quietus]|nr:hypothetical protein EI94DRAFT_1813809 [Lactarius quietus]